MHVQEQWKDSTPKMSEAERPVALGQAARVEKGGRAVRLHLCVAAWGQSGYSKMDATLHVCPGDFFKAAYCILDRIVAWFVIPDAGCQLL
jgi:hypothetical protein